MTYFSQCSKDSTDLLFGSLRIRDKRDKPLPPLKTNTIPDKYYIKQRFKIKCKK